MNGIISAATGYSDADLQPFLRSIERECPRASVFLMVYESDRERIEKLRHKFPFIEPVYVRRKLNRGGLVFRSIARLVIKDNYATRGALWNRLGRYPLHIMLERFFFALDIVRAHRHSLENVLLTDSRDVVFQKDPFSLVSGHIVSGLEEETIGNCAINSAWLTHLYGTEVQASLSNRKIVCAGVTMGPAKEVEQYLAEMCREIWKCLSKVAMVAQYDQGIHNYLIYNGKIHVELTTNRDGIIATLHHEDPKNIQTDDASGAVTVHGKRSAIVHQYDRHRNLVVLIKARLGN